MLVIAAVEAAEAAEAYVGVRMEKYPVFRMHRDLAEEEPD